MTWTDDEVEECVHSSQSSRIPRLYGGTLRNRLVRLHCVHAGMAAHPTALCDSTMIAAAQGVIEQTFQVTLAHLKFYLELPIHHKHWLLQALWAP